MVHRARLGENSPFYLLVLGDEAFRKISSVFNMLRACARAADAMKLCASIRMRNMAPFRGITLNLNPDLLTSEQIY